MAQTIVQAINVFILFFLVGYIAWDIAEGMLTKRKDRIAEEIGTAKLSREEALKLKEDYERRLADFETERAEILASARHKAEVAREYIMTNGQEEADRLVARADREAELKKLKLRDEVRRDMITVASAMAAKSIASGMDEAQQAVYIREMLDEMGETTWQN